MLLVHRRHLPRQSADDRIRAKGSFSDADTSTPLGNGRSRPAGDEQEREQRHRHHHRSSATNFTQLDGGAEYQRLVARL
jgi:hypothetical protein